MKIDKHRIDLSVSKYAEAIYRDTGDDIFDKELYFVIHGKPVTDSRPKYSSVTDMFYNPHKAAMKKLFKPIYNSDTTLQGIIIDKIMKVDIVAYYEPTKMMMKYMSERDIVSELFPSIVKKDNDNVEKLHYDLLTDGDFKVLLDDNLIVDNHTRKFTSFNERVEISIKFCSDTNKIHKVFDIMIKESLEYKYSMISYKYLNMHNMIEDVSKMNKHLIFHYHLFKLSKVKKFKSKFIYFTLSRLPSEKINEMIQDITNERKYKLLSEKANKDARIELYIKLLINSEDNINIEEGGVLKWNLMKEFKAE